MTKIRKQVSAFHKESNQPILEKPQVPDSKRTALRARLITEEYFEFMEAILPADCKDYLLNLKNEIYRSFLDPQNFDVDLVEVADSLGDIDYVVEGSRLEFGINGEPVMDEIQRSNMAKFGPGSWIDDTGKVRKPPNWTPPDISKVLKDQGWEG